MTSSFKYVFSLHSCNYYRQYVRQNYWRVNIVLYFFLLLLLMLLLVFMMMFFFSCLLPYRLAFFLLLDLKDVYYMILWDARNHFITVISGTKVIIRNITIALHKHAESEMHTIYTLSTRCTCVAVYICCASSTSHVQRKKPVCRHELCISD